jgi:hypothetical protein
VYFQEIDIDFDDAGQQEVSFESDDGGFQLKPGGRYEISERWFIEAGATYLPACLPRWSCQRSPARPG